MSKIAHNLVIASVAAIVSVPVAIVLTIALLPLWSWIEAAAGIESVGHSGPADWCYWVTLGIVFCIVCLALFVARRKGRAV
jgi:hypothetical protein